MNLNIGDSYNFDGSSRNDHVAFKGGSFSVQAVDIDSADDPDLACFNFDRYGETDSYQDDTPFYMDKCIYTSTSSRNQCISFWNVNLPTSKMASTSSFNTILLGNVCSGCQWDTSDDFGDFMQGQTYYDCDQSDVPSAVMAYDQFYGVIDQRQYYCSNNGGDLFKVRGRYYDRKTGTLKWINYDNKYCSDMYNDYYGCATNRDEVNDNTGTTYLSDPCALKDGNSPGNACSSNNDCISKNCGGDSLTFSFSCDSDGSDGYLASAQSYENSCGGQGFPDTPIVEDSTCSAEMGSSDYVCDGDLSVSFNGVSVDPSEFCKLKEYSSCNSDSGCWNNNGGYNCLGMSGNKVCTTGANGKTCYNNDDLQCTSFRCDGTCQSKLANGQSCDETSDCVNATCSGGVCGGTGVTVDLAIVKIEPVQVIKDVDLVKGKSGIVRVIVTNYGSNQSNGLVNVTFDGIQLNITSGDAQTKIIPPGRNVTFDFDFKPLNAGTKQIIANVSIA